LDNEKYQDFAKKVFNLEKIEQNFLLDFEEFILCKDSPENQKWHTEKNTLEHIDNVINNFFDFILNKQISYKNSVALYLTAIFHDFRKPQTLSQDREGIYHNIDHEKEASRYIFDFFYKTDFIDNQEKLDILILASKFIYWHMFVKKVDYYNDLAGNFVSSFSIEELSLLHDFSLIDGNRQSLENSNSKINLLLELKHKTFNYFPERDNPKLITIIGTPASGKTYLANELLKKYENSVLISTDDIRKELYGHESIFGKSSEVFGTAYSRMKNILSFDKKTVIFDSTNLKRNLRENLITIGQKRKIPMICYYLINDLNFSIKNNKARLRKVNEDIIRRMYNETDFPSYFEFNEIKYKHSFKL